MSATGLQLRGPITIEGEDKLTSQIKLVENTVESPQSGSIFDGQPSQAHLFDAQSPVAGQTLAGITLRNFTLSGSYLGSTSTDPTPPKDQLHGTASLFHFKNVGDVRLEDLVFSFSRGVIVGGDGVRSLSMTGCLMSESQRGGMVISGAADISVENNDFRWIPDDPIAINGSGPQGASGVGTWFYKYGGSIRLVGNRSLGCRGLNVVGVKNVLIADNIHILGRGRAIHVGVSTSQDKADTTMLDIIVRNNMIIDLLDAQVDPRFDGGNGGHRAIDIELLYAGRGPKGAMPGLPDPATGAVEDPTPYHYLVGQGLQGTPVWQPQTRYKTGDLSWVDGRSYKVVGSGDGGKSGNTPPPAIAPGAQVNDGGTNGVTWTYNDSVATPPALGILIEGNIVARTRPAATKFEDYGLGKYGGDAIGYANVAVPIAYITPSEGIGVQGAVRGLILRGNQIGGCDTCISFQGPGLDLPFYLRDVIVTDNDLSDWSKTAILFFNYDGGQRHRVSILGNRGDGDPNFRQPASVRNANGNWIADTNVGAFIETNGIGFLTLAGNHVRNVNRLISGLNDASHAMSDNIAYCDPAGLGFNTGNLGIGNLIHPALGWRYVIEDSTPTSATYGKALNTCPLASNAVPTSGKWVEGTFVKCSKTNPTTKVVVNVGTFEVTGWRRITTDSLHVLGTNWQQQWALTGV